MELHVQDPYLFYIQIGLKIVEGRRGNINKFSHWIGKKVYFFNSERKIPVIVEQIRWYKNLYDYLDAENYKNVIPDAKSIDDAIDIYHRFYSDDNIEKSGGMLAIQIKII